MTRPEQCVHNAGLPAVQRPLGLDWERISLKDFIDFSDCIDYAGVDAAGYALRFQAPRSVPFRLLVRNPGGASRPWRPLAFRLK